MSNTWKDSPERVRAIQELRRSSAARPERNRARYSRADRRTNKVDARDYR